MIGIAGHLEAGLVCIGDDVLSAVGQPVTRQAQRHAQAAILLLELLVSGALVLSSLWSRANIKQDESELSVDELRSFIISVPRTKSLLCLVIQYYLVFVKWSTNPHLALLNSTEKILLWKKVDPILTILFFFLVPFLSVTKTSWEEICHKLGK